MKWRRMRKLYILVASLVMLVSLSNAQDHGNHGSGEMGGSMPIVGPDVTIRFEAMIGDRPAACGMVYQNVGEGASTMSLLDYRFYVSNVRLVNSNGDEVPVELTQDGRWQYENVALLDFEDGTGGCNEVGNPDMNDKIVGTVPEGEYTALKFDLGLPFELNHLDTTTAPAPLNVPALWWNWQFGYKYARIDMQTPNGATPAFLIHLGATGCVADNGNTPPTEPCTFSNIPTITLENFSAVQNFVVADLGALLNTVNVDAGIPQPPGCMSMQEDTDCLNVFTNFGLSLETGTINESSSQAFFRVQ
jgi:uncharacterized repeat protein (TIGR04052 family)